MKKIIIALLVISLTSSALLGYGAAQVDVLDLRSKAMGGVRLTIPGNQYTIMNNPAGLALMKKSFFSFVQAKVVVSGDLFDLMNNKDKILAVSDTGVIDNATWNLLSRLKVSIAASPVYLGYVGGGFGLVLFNTLRAKITSNPDVPLPTWNIEANHDMVLMAGYAMPLLDFKFASIYAGINLKLIQRLQLNKSRMDILYMASIADADLSDFAMKRGLAIGSDIGFVAEFGRALKASLTITDFFGTKFNWVTIENMDNLASEITSLSFNEDTGDHDYIEPSVNLGASLTIRSLPFIPKILVKNIVLALDIRDFFDNDVNMFLKLYVGAEFTLLGFLKPRIGLYQGWITAGLGIDIPILPMEINFAYWGEELGDYPGQERLDNIALTVNFVI